MHRRLGSVTVAAGFPEFPMGEIQWWDTVVQLKKNHDWGQNLTAASAVGARGPTCVFRQVHKCGAIVQTCRIVLCSLHILSFPPKLDAG